MTSNGMLPNENSEMDEPIPSNTAPPKVVDAGVEPIEAKPPAASPIPLQKTGGIRYNLDDMTLQMYAKHVALWTQPLLSAKYLLATFVVWYYTAGEEGCTFVGLLTGALLFRVLIVSLPKLLGNYLISAHPDQGVVVKIGEGLVKTATFVKTHTEMPTKKSVSFWTNGVAELVEKKLMSARDAVEKAETDFRMLKVVVFHLLATSVVFWMMSPRFMIFATLFIGLTVPPVYAREFKRIDPLIEQAQAKVQPIVAQIEAKGNDIAEKARAGANSALGQVKGKYAELKAKHAPNAEAKKTA